MKTGLACIGCGQMGSAIMAGLADRGNLPLTAMDPNAARINDLVRFIPDLNVVYSAAEAAESSGVLLLAIKPQLLPGILKELEGHITSDHLIVSIAAGISLAAIKNATGNIAPVVRAMPNIGILAKRGMAALCLDDPALPHDQKSIIFDLFRPVAETYVLPESMFDAYTAVAASGPAYVFYLMEAMVQATVSLGFPRDTAGRMAAQVVLGAGHLADQTGTSAWALREMVESPAGTTIAATMHLDRQAVGASIADAIRIAAKRAKELGE